MEPYERYADRSNPPSSDAYMQLLSSTHPHQQLPGFRDIIPAHLHSAIEARNSASEHQSPATASSKFHGLGGDSRSVAPSPVQSHTNGMPSLSEAYNDLNGRAAETVYSSHPVNRRQGEQIPAWSNPTQQVDARGYEAQQTPAYPNLPPLRDMHGRSDRPRIGNEAGYSASISPYPQLYGGTVGSSPDVEADFYSRRTPYYDQNQRQHQTYPPISSHQLPANQDYPRLTQATPYEPYRIQPTYPTTYSEMDFPPQMANGSAPQSNFGVVGDAADARGKRRRGNLPKATTDVLRTWFVNHLEHPYPSEEEKQYFIHRTGLSISQISNWFINARRRQLPQLRALNHERASHGPSDTDRSESQGAK